MRRLLSVATVMAVVAAMVVANAVPAFADKGAGGHVFDPVLRCDGPISDGPTCTNTRGFAGGGGGSGGGGGGKTTVTYNSDFDPANPSLSLDQNHRGGSGSPGGGSGGNCSQHTDLFPDISVGEPTGSGSAC